MGEKQVSCFSSARGWVRRKGFPLFLYFGRKSRVRFLPRRIQTSEVSQLTEPIGEPETNISTKYDEVLDIW